VLAALLVLALVITTTMAMFVERQKRMQAASETILAYQAIANEIEVRRRIPYAELEKADTTFITDTTILKTARAVRGDGGGRSGAGLRQGRDAERALEKPRGARVDLACRYRRERPVVKRSMRGFTLMEVVVALALFGVFLWIVVILTADMRNWEKRMPINYMTHPQISAVISRLRRDVEDATNPYYLESYESRGTTYNMTDKTLILYRLQTAGTAETVVWDFSTDGEVTRRSFTDIAGQTSAWAAHGTPTFSITNFPVPGHPYSVRIQAVDKDGKLAIDQIIQPRPH
jgi:prepilin-type N-terminal cleavage/methylation domain-containing protein